MIDLLSSLNAKLREVQAEDDRQFQDIVSGKSRVNVSYSDNLPTDPFFDFEVAEQAPFTRPAKGVGSAFSHCWQTRILEDGESFMVDPTSILLASPDPSDIITVSGVGSVFPAAAGTLVWIECTIASYPTVDAASIMYGSDMGQPVEDDGATPVAVQTIARRPISAIVPSGDKLVAVNFTQGILVMDEQYAASLAYVMPRVL